MYSRYGAPVIFKHKWYNIGWEGQTLLCEKLLTKLSTLFSQSGHSHSYEKCKIQNERRP